MAALRLLIVISFCSFQAFAITPLLHIMGHRVVLSPSYIYMPAGNKDWEQSSNRRRQVGNHRHPLKTSGLMIAPKSRTTFALFWSSRYTIQATFLFFLYRTLIFIYIFKKTRSEPAVAVFCSDSSVSRLFLLLLFSSWFITRVRSGRWLLQSLSNFSLSGYLSLFSRFIKGYISERRRSLSCITKRHEKRGKRCSLKHECICNVVI